MGNGLGRGRRNKAKVMTITGETFKLRTPIQVRDAVAGHPGHVLLDSESVKQLGVRAVPLEPDHPLMPNKLYFLVQLPPADAKIGTQEEAAPRRVRSAGIQMSAKERLECLMLARRSASELPIPRSAPAAATGRTEPGGLTVRMRLSKAQMAELVEESRDDVEVAEKVLRLYMKEKEGKSAASGEINGRGSLQPQLHRVRPEWTAADHVRVPHERRRVRFNPTQGEGEIVEVVPAAASVP